MANKLDSTSLFLAQVNQHAEVLGGLLSGVAEDQIDGARIERCILSTHMLSRSASLMELPEWQGALDAYEHLLKTYEEKSLPWDERIAQVTSEFIEKEDLLAASACDPGQTGLSGAVSAEELEALSIEMRELLEYVKESADEAQNDGTERSPAADETSTSPAADGEVPARDKQGRTRKGRGCLPVERGLEASMAELQRHTAALLDAWEKSDGMADCEPASTIPLLREKLLVIGFHALSMDRVIESRSGNLPLRTIGTLAPLRVALQDYARALSRGTDRRADFTLSGEDRPIDPRLLLPIHRVLQHMMGDVFLRCREKRLRIDIAVEDNHGALHWTLRDNGETFVSDSRLDGDEYLAFYPGLRDTRKVLGELNALLWVELDGNRGTRFAFTTPASLQDSAFVVWGTGKDRVAVLSNQLARIHAADDVEFAPDSHGERIISGGRQVRVLRLGDLYSEGPVDGDKIAVIGALEKRVAFYTAGEERMETGTWNRNGVAAGRAMEGGTAHVGTERIPLVEANALLNKYISIVEAISEQDSSGGVDVDVSVPSHTQAILGKDAKAPPEIVQAKNDVDVLVVEQSESLRKLLDTLLSHAGFVTRVVDGPVAALSFLGDARAAVVISDFRVPSMAAKAVAEFLRGRESGVPVFVTTSQQGENADLLVERLGVAGHIGKPFDPDAVIARVAAHVRRPVGRSAGRR